MAEKTSEQLATKGVREYLDALVWDGRARFARWLYRRVIRLVPDTNAEGEPRKIRLRDEILRADGSLVHEDDPIIDVIHRALGDRTGKLRVSDAFLICGLEAGKVNQDQIVRFGQAIRELGWQRQRRRFDGTLEYAYVKGTAAEREVELVVEYDPHMRNVRIGTVDKTAAA